MQSIKHFKHIYKDAFRLNIFVLKMKIKSITISSSKLNEIALNRGVKLNFFNKFYLNLKHRYLY